VYLIFVISQNGCFMLSYINLLISRRHCETLMSISMDWRWPGLWLQWPSVDSRQSTIDSGEETEWPTRRFGAGATL